LADLIKALTAAGKVSTGVVAATLIVLGGFLTIGGLVYRVFVQPEWTFGEALYTLWPVFLVGTASLMLGWFVDRAEG
jgi:hypothetical protein